MDLIKCMVIISSEQSRVLHTGLFNQDFTYTLICLPKIRGPSDQSDRSFKKSVGIQNMLKMHACQVNRICTGCCNNVSLLCRVAE